MPLLLGLQPRAAAPLGAPCCEASTSGRSPAPLLRGGLRGRAWVQQPARQVARRAEYSRDPRSGGGAGGAGGPATQPQQQPWPDSYNYAPPPPAAAQPPRGPPRGGSNGSGPDGGGGGGGLSNLTRAFIGGAFILGGLGCSLAWLCWRSLDTKSFSCSISLPPLPPPPVCVRRHGRGHLVQQRGDL